MFKIETDFQHHEWQDIASEIFTYCLKQYTKQLTIKGVTWMVKKQSFMLYFLSFILKHKYAS